MPQSQTTNRTKLSSDVGFISIFVIVIALDPPKTASLRLSHYYIYYITVEGQGLSSSMLWLSARSDRLSRETSLWPSRTQSDFYNEMDDLYGLARTNSNRFLSLYIELNSDLWAYYLAREK